MNDTKKGKLNIVGIGPGNEDYITPASLRAIQEAEIVIGYSTYIKLVQHLLSDKQIIRTGMTEEIRRAQLAIEESKKGKIVSIISSGDAGVYGMASLIFQVLEEMGWKKSDDPEIHIYPGITAINACASLIGAPLGHDFCSISLSDLLTPWPIIRKRIELAAQADFVIGFYNPASGRRQKQIVEAKEIIEQYRPGTTPVALIKSAYRERQHIIISDLDHFLDYEIGMLTTVIVGSTNTRFFEGYIYTPRGYTNKYNIIEGTVKSGQKPGISLNLDAIGGKND
jgi:precorrin-3B C17-methyltransferase